MTVKVLKSKGISGLGYVHICSWDPTSGTAGIKELSGFQLPADPMPQVGDPWDFGSGPETLIGVNYFEGITNGRDLSFSWDLTSATSHAGDEVRLSPNHWWGSFGEMGTSVRSAKTIEEWYSKYEEV